MDLKKDWPIAAAAVVIILALILMTRKSTGNVPVKLGGGASQDSIIAAQVQLEQSRQQAYVGLASAIISGQIQHEQLQLQEFKIKADLEATLAQTNAQLEAARMQARNQSQNNLFNFLGGILPFIFGLFCPETTEAAIASRRKRSANILTGYGLTITRELTAGGPHPRHTAAGLVFGGQRRDFAFAGR